jgi:hypothetical protein
MKVLSMTQPWALLYVLGIKEWETRSWETLHRGELLIHAAKGYPGWARDFAEELYQSYSILRRYSIIRGAIIGRVEIVECRRTEDVAKTLSREELKLGDFSEGRYCWKATNRTRFTPPILKKGHLGLWDYDGALPPSVCSFRCGHGHNANDHPVTDTLLFDMGIIGD